MVDYARRYLNLVLPCKNGYFWKLELVRAMSVLVLQYSCNFSAIGFSQVEVCCAYLSGEIHVLRIASVSLGLPIQFVHCC